jgi:hypothetical protein
MERGTLLELAVWAEGDEVAIVEALRGGYELTGNFRGREHEVLADYEVAVAPEAA